MLNFKTKEIISDDRLFDKELDQLDQKNLQIWFNGTLNYVVTQYYAYKELPPFKKTKGRKQLMLTNFRNLIKNFIYKLEKLFAIQQLIYLIEIFIRDEELINYTESMLFRPVDTIYQSIPDKTEELILLYERLKMDYVYIKYYTAFQNNSLQIGSVHEEDNKGGNTMGNIIEELKTNIKEYITNNDSKERIFLSLLRIKQINDSLSNSANEKIIDNSRWINKVLIKHFYSDSVSFQTFLFECTYNTYKLYTARYNSIILMDDLNKENFNGDNPLNRIDDDEETIENKKKNLLKEAGDFIISVLKYFKKAYKSTNNQNLKNLYSKYISWYKVFLFIHHMDLLYNELPFICDEKEFNTDISNEFKNIYHDVLVNKYEDLDRNVISQRNNTDDESDGFIAFWTKSYEMENRDILEKKLDTNNFYFSGDDGMFYMKLPEKVEFTNEEIREDEEDEEEERGRSKKRNKKNSKNSNKSKSKSKSRSRSRSKSRSKNKNSKSKNKSKSRSLSRSQSMNRSSNKVNENSNNGGKIKKVFGKNKRIEALKYREALPSEKKLNEVSYTIMKMLIFWNNDKNRLFIILKSLPSFTDININYRHGKKHSTLTSYGYTILSIIYIALDLISLAEGVGVSVERIESLKDNAKVIICPFFEFIDVNDIVNNIISKSIPIKYIIYLWQTLFQLMEWPIFLKISQIIQRYFEVHNEDTEVFSNYKKLFNLEWNIYVNISYYFTNIEKKEDEKEDEEKDNKPKTIDPNGRRFSGFLRDFADNSKNGKSNINNKSIIENAFNIKLYDNLKDLTESEIDNVISNIQYGIYELYNYIIFAIENQMGSIFNINTFIRILWNYCLRLYPEKKNYKCISNKNTISYIRLIISCIRLYRKFYPSYVNPIVYCKIIQQYIVILLNNDYEYDAKELVKRIKDDIKIVDVCLYSARGTSHTYHSLSYNPSVFGRQFEFMTLSASKSPKKKEIIHSLIHKKYVLYGLMFRIAILDRRKEYYKIKAKKEKEYYEVYKKKLTTYPEFMNKPSPQILETYCGKNNYLKSLFHLQFSIALRKYLSKSEIEEILMNALAYLQATHEEEAVLIQRAYLNSEDMNRSTSRNICPPPICIKRNNNSLVFRPLPPRNKRIKPFYYKIFCKQSGIGNVTMSDCSYSGTDEFILNKKEETEIIINGLKENQKYIVAVAAYDKNKNLLCGRIGAQTTPILVAYPLPLLINLSYLGQFSSIEGLSYWIPYFEHYIFDYFVENLCDESELTHSFIKEPYWIKKNSSFSLNYNHLIYSTESLIKNFISILLINTRNENEKMDIEESYDYSNEVNISKKWIIKKLKLCQRFLICMELANKIKNDQYLVVSMLLCYNTVVPFLSFDNPPEFVIHVLMKCHTVFMKRDAFDPSTLNHIYDNYFASLTHTLIYFLNLWKMKEELFLICKNTLNIVNNFIPKNGRIVPSNIAIDHLWNSTMDKFKKAHYPGKKVAGVIDYLYFTTSSIFSNDKLIERTTTMVHLADYADFILQLNELNISVDKKSSIENCTTMGDIEYGIHVNSLESMYLEINKYKKSKRYMEMLYKLISEAFNRQEYDFIYKIYFEILEWINKRNFFLLHSEEINKPEIQKEFKKIKGRQRSIFSPKLDEKSSKKKKKLKRSNSNSKSRSRSRSRRSSSVSSKHSRGSSTSRDHSDSTKKKKDKQNNSEKSSKTTSDTNSLHQRSYSFDDNWNKYNGQKRSSSFSNEDFGRNRSHSQDIQYTYQKHEEKVENKELLEKEKKIKAINVLANVLGVFWKRYRFKKKLNELINYENFYLCMIHYVTATSISRIIEKDIMINEIKAPSLGISDFYLDIGNYFTTGYVYNIYDRKPSNYDRKNSKDGKDKDNKDNKDSKDNKENKEIKDIKDIKNFNKEIKEVKEPKALKSFTETEKYCTELLECFVKSMIISSRSKNWNILLLCFHQLWNFIGDMRKLEIMNTKYWRLEAWKPFYMVSIELLDFLEIHCMDDDKYQRDFEFLDLIKNDKKRIFRYYYVNRWGYNSDISINIKLIIKFFIDTLEFLFYSEKYSLVISFGIRFNHYFHDTLTEVLANIMNESMIQYNRKNPKAPLHLPDTYKKFINVPNDMKSLGSLVINCKGDFIKYIYKKYTFDDNNNNNNRDLVVHLRKTILNYEYLIKMSKEYDDIIITAVAYSDLGDLLYESGDVESAGLFWSKSIDSICQRRMIVASINEFYQEIKELSTATILKMFNNSIYILILVGFQLAKLASYCFSSNSNAKLNITMCASFLLSKAIYSFISEPHVPRRFIYIPNKTTKIINVISEFFKDQSSIFIKLLKNLIIELVSNDYPGLAIPLLAFQLIVAINSSRSLREVIFVKLMYAKVLIKCGLINEGLHYLCNVISGKGIFDSNPLDFLNSSQNNGNSNNYSTFNTNSGIGNQNSNVPFIVNYNNMEGIYESNNLYCIKILLYTKITDRLISQYGRMMTKVIEFEKISCIIEIFSLFHGNYVYYDSIRSISDHLLLGEQNAFDVKSIKERIYEDVLGLPVKRSERPGKTNRRVSIRRESLIMDPRRKKSISFNMAAIKKTIINNENSSSSINSNNNSNSSGNNSVSNIDIIKLTEDKNDNKVDGGEIKVNGNNDNNSNDKNDNKNDNNNTNTNTNNDNNNNSNNETQLEDKDKETNEKPLSRISSSHTVSTDYSTNANEYNISDRSNNNYSLEKSERDNILKFIEEIIFHFINEVYNETKQDNKPYRPYQINFFSYCILSLADIYKLMNKNRRAVTLLLSLSDFLSKRVNAISEYLESIDDEENETHHETAGYLIDKKVYEEKLLVDIRSGSELWLEVKKQTAFHALIINDFNYAIIVSKSGLRDASLCKSSIYKLEFLKIIICSKIRLHSKGVKKYVSKFEEILKSPNLSLKAKFEAHIFYFDVTTKLNIYTSEEILNRRGDAIENCFYELMIPQSLILEDINRLTKYSPCYNEYVIYLYQQAVLYKSTHQYDLSLKCLRCAINIMKYFINISSFICLPILNKYYQLLMIREDDKSSLKTVDSVCRTIIDISIKEGGYNVRALKHGFSGLFICFSKMNEIYDAFNCLYILSIIGEIINNIRLLNVNTEFRAHIMEHTIKSKSLRNDVKLWYAKENQLYEIYDNLYVPLDIATLKSKDDVKEHVHLDASEFCEEKMNENIYLYYKYLFFDTNILDNIGFDYYSCSNMTRLQRTHQIILSELPDDILSQMTISRLLNINSVNDSKYIAKFENMCMAQWFHRWNLPYDYDYENVDDETESIDEKKANDEFINKKIVLVIYHQDVNHDKDMKELVAKIKKLKKEIKFKKRKDSSTNSSKYSAKVSSKELSKINSINDPSSGSDNNNNNNNNNNDNDDNSTTAASTNSNNEFARSQQSNKTSTLCFSDKGNKNKHSSDGNMGSIFSSLSDIMSKINSTTNSESLLGSTKPSSNENGSKKDYTPEIGKEIIEPQVAPKSSLLENGLVKQDDFPLIGKEINEQKEIYNQTKIRNKYYNMDESEFQFANGDPNKIYDKKDKEEDEGDEGGKEEEEEDRISPKELELKRLLKKLFKKCIYSVKIPKTIVKEVQFICARNEADSKNFFFTKESESTILDQKLKKDLINNIIKYIVGPEIEYEITDEILNSENLIENIAALFDSDRGMLFEENNVFSNWLYDICLKRKAMNKSLNKNYVDIYNFYDKSKSTATTIEEEKERKPTINS